jgi:hypothetical protein
MLKDEFDKEGFEKTFELIMETEEDLIKETVSAYKENIQKEIQEAEQLITSNIKNAEKKL